MPKHVNKKLYGTIEYMPHAYELKTAAELKNLLENDDDAVILLYKQNCGPSRSILPTFEEFASDIHLTNLNDDIPIVVAQIEADGIRKEINDTIPYLTFGNPDEGTGFPLVLIKRGDTKEYVPLPESKRTEEGMLSVASEVLENENLNPDHPQLFDIMNNRNPEFILYYNSKGEFPDRFSFPLDVDNTITTKQAVRDVVGFFRTHPEFASRGLAIPMDLYVRRDLPFLGVYDYKTDKSYTGKQLIQWILDNSQSNSQGNLNYQYSQNAPNRIGKQEEDVEEEDTEDVDVYNGNVFISENDRQSYSLPIIQQNARYQNFLQ